MQTRPEYFHGHHAEQPYDGHLLLHCMWHNQIPLTLAHSLMPTTILPPARSSLWRRPERQKSHLALKPNPDAVSGNINAG